LRLKGELESEGYFRFSRLSFRWMDLGPREIPEPRRIEDRGLPGKVGVIVLPGDGNGMGIACAYAPAPNLPSRNEVSWECVRIRFSPLFSQVMDLRYPGRSRTPEKRR